jgi:hypothetical protein
MTYRLNLAVISSSLGSQSVVLRAFVGLSTDL